MERTRRAAILHLRGRGQSGFALHVTGRIYNAVKKAPTAQQMNGKLMIISIPCYSRGKTFSIHVYNDIHGICKQRLLGSIVQSGNSNVKCVTLLHRDTGMFAELPFAANGNFQCSFDRHSKFTRNLNGR